MVTQDHLILGPWLQLHSRNFVSNAKPKQLHEPARRDAEVQGSSKDSQRTHEGANLPSITLQRHSKLTERQQT